MARKKEFQTSSFTIAHYILLFMVAVVCASVVTWLVLQNHRRNVVRQMDVAYIANNSPCVKHARDAVKQIWTYNQELIPTRYKIMVHKYVNEVVPVRIKGYCGDEPFMCRMGQVRNVCDPCVKKTAQEMAMTQHMADVIYANCGIIVSGKLQ